MHQRAEEGERLMDWAFANFEDVTLFTAGDVDRARAGVAGHAADACHWSAGGTWW